MKLSIFAEIVAAGICLLLPPNEASARSIVGIGSIAHDPALAGGKTIGFDGIATGQYDSLKINEVTFVGVNAPFDVGSDFNGEFNTSGGKSLFNLVRNEFQPAE